MLAVWAEMDAVLADEFRDGNVPAQMAPLTVAKAAFAALPKTVTNYYYRGDAACHEKELLRWLFDEKRADGPQGCIGFAISVRMSEALRAAILEVPEKEWKAYGKPEPGIDRECAEVVFVSGEEAEPKGASHCATSPSGCANGREDYLPTAVTSDILPCRATSGIGKR